MKKYLQELIKRLNQQLTDLRSRNEAASTVEEVRSIGSEIERVNNELREAQTQLDAIEAEEQRQAAQSDQTEQRGQGFNPTAAMSFAQQVAPAGQNEDRSNMTPEEIRGTMEYRTAFMNYIQRGTIDRNILQFEQRDNGSVTTSADLGVLIPVTVMQDIIKGVDKIYGQLYRRVRKMNLRGGVKFPLGSFGASFRRITETTVSARQSGGGITGYIEFSYKIGEIRLAKTLLQSVLTVEVFEREFAEVVAEAYVKAMDMEIMTGTEENNQMVGILTEAAAANSRIPADHIIEFTAADMADWKSWQTKLFAQIPLALRGDRFEFVMTPNTYEANIKTLADDNNRPVYYETYNPVDGTERATFKGKEVVFVENDVFANFNDATDGQYFGMYWVPDQAYCINSNMEFSVVDYYDQETNQWIKKALVINDGKVLRPNYLYLLKKKVSA